MNVLLVAPDSDFPHVDAEIQAVANALHPIMLLGDNATSSALLTALESPFDLIWFAAHGNSDGIQLADGPLQRETLTQFLRGQDAAIFLNTCESLSVALDIYDELAAKLICTIRSVADLVAYHTGALLARYLGDGKSLREAYNLAKPGRNRQFLYLNGDISGHTDRMDDLLIEMRRGNGALQQRINEVERQLNERMNGIEVDLGSRFDRLIEDLRSNYQLKLRRGNLLRLGIGCTLFTISIWLFYSDVRRALEINVVVAGILAMVLLPASAYLFVSGIGFSFEGE